MLKRIDKSQCQVMPWKNGQGITSQIAIFPETAAFPSEEFLWRLSSAAIQASSTFSQFPGCDRLLVVWRGEGLLLNGTHLPPLVPCEFSGETPMSCELLGDEVLDLGVIVRRGRVRATMEIKEVHAGSNVMICTEGVYLLFCLEGNLVVQGISIHAADTMQIEAESRIEISSAASAKYVEINLRTL